MKKLLLSFMLLLAFVQNGNSQCSTLTAPPVSGNTIAACTTSASFTLTATGSGINAINWYTNSVGGNAINTGSVFTTPTLTTSTTYYVGQSNATGPASLSLPAFASAYSGNTRGMWFTAPTCFMINGLRVPTDVGTGNSWIVVMKFAANPPAFSSTTNSFTILYFGQNISGTNIIPVNIPISNGDIIGILGCRATSSSYATSYGSAGPQVVTLGTYTTTLNRLGMQYVLATTPPQDIWTENASIGRIEVYTDLGSNSPLTPVTLSVIPQPTVILSGPTNSICANSSTTLTAAGVGNYTWSTGSNANSIVVTPNTLTTYTCVGSVGSNCTASAAIQVSVSSGAPTLTLTASNNSICSGNTVAINASGAITYTFSNGVNNNVAFTPTASAAFTVTGANACGVATAVKQITVNPTPTITPAVPVTSICLGQSATLSVSGADNYTWTTINSTGSTAVVSPTSTSAYNVVGETNAGCSSTGVQIVVVKNTPTVSITNPSPLVCANSTVVLTANGANTYTWGDGSNGTSISVTPSATTIYTLTGEYTSTQCQNSTTVQVAVYIPTTSISSPSAVCLGKTATLSANGGDAFSWSPGGPFQSIVFTPTATQIFTLTVSSTSDNVLCSADYTTQLGVNQLPTISIAATKTAICSGEGTELTANGGNSYAWTSSTITAATYSINNLKQTTSYTVTGTDNNGCSSTATVQIKVNTCIGLNEQTAPYFEMYPNPAKDQLHLKNVAAGTVSIYNLAGQLVHQVAVLENESEINVDLASGLYLIKHSANPAVSAKIIIE